MLSTIKIFSNTDDTLTGSPWTDDQKGCVMEIRSEHKLNDLSTFSILMHDIPDRREDSERRLLAAGHHVGVLVRPEPDDDWQVLFFGKVVEQETHETQGGIGSTILYKGVDIRYKMAGRSFTGAWTGTVKDVMEGIIGLDFPEHQVDEPENNELDGDENPLSQNSNNLEFVRDQAVAFGFNFWVSYETIAEDALGGALDALDPRPPTVTVAPTVHWAMSPYLAAKLGQIIQNALSALLPSLGGASSDLIEFKVHMSGNACANVTSFEVSGDGQETQLMPPGQPNNGLGAEMPAGGLTPFADENSADAPVVYLVPPTVSPDADEEEEPTFAQEMARSFKKKVKLSTTMRHIKTLCKPHENAVLRGVTGGLGDIMFRISETTHVIRIADHYIDATLESDGSVPVPVQAPNPLQGAN